MRKKVCPVCKKEFTCLASFDNKVCSPSSSCVCFSCHKTFKVISLGLNKENITYKKTKGFYQVGIEKEYSIEFSCQLFTEKDIPIDISDVDARHAIQKL